MILNEPKFFTTYRAEGKERMAEIAHAVPAAMPKPRVDGLAVLFFGESVGDKSDSVTEGAHFVTERKVSVTKRKHSVAESKISVTKRKHSVTE